MTTRNRKCGHDKWMHCACYICGRPDARKRAHAEITNSEESSQKSETPPPKRKTTISKAKQINSNDDHLFKKPDPPALVTGNPNPPILVTNPPVQVTEKQEKTFLTKDPIPFPTLSSPENEAGHVIVHKGMTMPCDERYEIIDLLATGGFGQTFLANDRLNRCTSVAIKISCLSNNAFALSKRNMLLNVREKCDFKSRQLFPIVLSSFIFEGHHCIVLEYIGGCDLSA